MNNYYHTDVEYILCSILGKRDYFMARRKNSVETVRVKVRNVNCAQQATAVRIPAETKKGYSVLHGDIAFENDAGRAVIEVENTNPLTKEKIEAYKNAKIKCYHFYAKNIIADNTLDPAGLEEAVIAALNNAEIVELY